MQNRSPSPALRLERRTFLRTTTTLAAGAALPAGGVFAAGAERIRVGLVGCGGRGTGAALQAAADPAVEIVSLGDLFADQVASCAERLARRAGTGFACPPDRRFTGPDAWRQVVESPVDVVILATPPAFRPLHVAAAVRAGRHVYCERPAAVDVAGVLAVLEACDAAARRGLSFASGLAHRHDEAVRAAVARIRAGGIGLPRTATLHARIGSPWLVPARPVWSAAERRLRNWICDPSLSGGHFVERHVAAIDRGLWALGDEDPAAVVPVGPPVAAAAATRVRFLFTDGRALDAALDRGGRGETLIVESVGGTAGTADLPTGVPAADANAAAMRGLLEAVRTGRTLAAGGPLCRATLAAVLGRRVAETGTALRWSDGVREAARSPRPLQSRGS